MTLKTRIFIHHPRVPLARFTLCWWCPNQLTMTSQWPNHCDTNTWQVISNSLDINFIQGDIHGRSCKKSWSNITRICLMRPIKSHQKHVHFIISLTQFLQNQVYSPWCERPPVLRNHTIQQSIYTSFTVYKMTVRKFFIFLLYLEKQFSVLLYTGFTVHRITEAKSGFELTRHPIAHLSVVSIF